MTDPELLSTLEGQQYLVLRPVGQVAEFYDVEQAHLLAGLPLSVSHPNTGHLTLRGFAEPARLPELKAVLEDWAAHQPPIDLSVDGIDGFPPPFQILIGRLERTPSLVDAYAALSSALDCTDLHRIGELPLDQWVFHLSLVYCGTLTEADWLALAAASSKVVRPRPREFVSQAEFVWYEQGVEHSTILRFGG